MIQSLLIEAATAAPFLPDRIVNVDRSYLCAVSSTDYYDVTC